MSSPSSENCNVSFGVCLRLLLVLLLAGSACSHWVVDSLPGFSGNLPFTLETGYVNVGEVEFFYYFVRSQGNPGADPLLLYLNGGPGCSGLNGFFYQIGPLKFNISDYTGGLPQLLLDDNSWTKTANIIFLDAPVGTGFTYATNASDYVSSDTISTNRTYSFIRNWLDGHPDYMTNPFFIGTDSYAGIIAPMLAQAIIDGNEAGLEPVVNLKGLSLGCAHTDTTIESNTKITFAHRMALISDSMYKAAKTSCNGMYVDVEPTNSKCEEALEAITQCTTLIDRQHILEPDCSFLSPKQNEAARRLLQANSHNFLKLTPRLGDTLWCRNFEYLLSDIWANYKSVQDALHVKPGTVKKFMRCNITLDYTVNVNNVVPYHVNLTATGLQLLVFSGDHDMVIPHIGIEQWIKSLDLSIDIDWRPWFVDGQVAGYTRRYTDNGYRLTYATVKGAGHSPQEFKRRECYDMFYRWIHYYPV